MLYLAIALVRDKSGVKAWFFVASVHDVGFGYSLLAFFTHSAAVLAAMELADGDDWLASMLV